MILWDGGTKPTSLSSIGPTCSSGPSHHSRIFGPRSPNLTSTRHTCAAGVASIHWKSGGITSTGNSDPSRGYATVIPLRCGTAASTSA